MADRIRPFDPNRDQPRPNSDGSYSTELTRTVQTSTGWANVPSLWFSDRGAVDLGSYSDDQLAELAEAYELDSRKRFPRFKSLNDAEQAAQQRSAKGGASKTELASRIPMAEPTLDQMYRDLAEADELGDTELANAIGQRIYVAERQTDAERLRAEQKSRFQRGGKAALKEALPRLIENFGQLVAFGRELAGSEGAVKEQTAEMNARRLAATGGDPVAEEGADLGETVALMATGAVPGGAMFAGSKAPTLTRALGRIGAEAAIGGGGFMGASEEAQTAGDVFAQRATGTALAAGIPVVAGTVIGARPAVHNFLVRIKQKAQQNEAQVRALQSGLPGRKSPLPLSVQTGNTVVAGLERQVQQTKAQNYYNQVFEETADMIEPVLVNMEKVRRRLELARGRKGTVGGDSASIALRVSKALRSQAAKEQRAASDLYGKSLSKAVGLAAADSARFPIPFASTAQTAEKWAAQNGDQWWRQLAPGAEPAPGAMAQLSKYFGNIQAGPFTQGLDIPELILLRKNLNAMDKDFYNAIRASSKAPSEELVSRHRVLREVTEALDSDIDAFLKANPSDRPAAQALQELRAANNQYAEYAQIRDQNEKLVTNQLFGYEVPKNPDKALRDVAALPGSEQRFLLNVLRQNDPAALADLRFTLTNNAFRAMVGGGSRAARTGKVDPSKFEAFITNEYGEVLGSELFTPKEYALLNRGLNDIRVLRGGVQGQVDPNTVLSAESATMAVASQSPTFLSRALFRVGGTKALERLLLTEEGIKSLDILVDVYRGGTKYKQPEIARAMGHLSAIAAAGEQPDERAE